MEQSWYETPEYLAAKAERDAIGAQQEALLAQVRELGAKWDVAHACMVALTPNWLREAQAADQAEWAVERERAELARLQAKYRPAVPTDEEAAALIWADPTLARMLVDDEAPYAAG